MNKIVGLENISIDLIKKLESIESEDLVIGRKNQKVKRACKKAMDNLWIKVDTSKPDGNQELTSQKQGFIHESTYNSYLTRLRRKINEAGIKSFTLNHDLEKLNKDCKVLKNKLKKIDTSTAITIRLTMKPLRDLVKKDEWWSTYGITEKQAKKIENSILRFSGDNKAAMGALTRDEKFKERSTERAKASKKKIETLKLDRKLSVIKVIELSALLTKSRNWEYLAIGIALATGRRASEILHFGTFEPLDKARFKFSGQRKNRSKVNDVNTLPCLIDSKLVVEAVERLRNMTEIKKLKSDWGSISESEQALKLNNRSHGKLCSAIDELMRSIYNDNGLEYHHWVFKDSRAAYAHTAIAMLEARELSAGREFKYKGEKLGKYYFQTILLHTSDETSELYESFTILESKAELKRYQIDKARERGNNSYFENRVELLEAWQAENTRKAFGKYIKWCIEAVTKDPCLIINNTILRTECKGRATIVVEFVEKLKTKKLDQADLILVIPKEKKTETKIKTVSVTYTVTTSVEIEVEINDGEDEEEVIKSAISTEYFDNSDMWDGDMCYEIDYVDDME